MKILVVDDDRTNRMVLNALLVKEAYEVVVAENGQQAIELFVEYRPDMVLMDVMMPVMDGYDATRKIKSISSDLGEFVPVIFLTALNDESALWECVACGGDDFLTKPYSRVILRSKILALERVRNLYDTIKDQRDQLSIHQAHLLREQEVAERVFGQIVHPGCLNVPQIKYLLSPMSVFNGDLLLAARKPTGGLHVILGDFTGHGLAASIGAIPVSEAFYSMTEKGFSVGDIVAETNAKLKAVLPSDIFFAACYMEISKDYSTLSVWHGGVPDLLIYDNTGSIRRRVNSTHLPLGVVDNDKLDRSVEIFELFNGDRLYAYTDGVIEASGKGGDMFGQDRFEAIFAQNEDPGQLFDELLHGLQNYCDGVSQSDDTTMIEICCDASLREEETIDRQHLSHTENPPREWSFSMRLNGLTLKDFDPLPQLTQVLMDIQGLHDHRERVYTVLAELYTNALDHGLLRLDSRLKGSPEGFAEFYQQREVRIQRLQQGWVNIDLSHQIHDGGGRLTITVEDSGEGFDVEQLSQSLETNLQFSGRGIPLVRTLCSELDYQNRGTLAKAVYDWD